MSIYDKFLTSLIILGPTIYFGLMENIPAMSIVLIAGCITVFFYNIDRFDYFKTSIFEGHMTKIERRMNQLVNDIDLYLEKIEKINNDAINKFTIVPSFDKKATELTLIKEVDDIVFDLHHSIKEIYEKACKTEDSLIQKLKDSNVNVSDCEGYKSFESSTFEIFELGVSNSFIRLNLKLAHLRLLRIKAELMNDPDNEMLKSQLKDAEKKLEIIISTPSLSD